MTLLKSREAAETDADAEIRARVDAILPEGWLPAQDVVVMVGQGAAPLIGELYRRGQERVVVYLPDEINDAALNESVMVVRTLSELMDTIQLMPGDPAEQVITVKTRESTVPQERIQDISQTVEECLHQYHSNRATMNALGHLWARNSVSNLPAVANWPGVGALEGAFKGVPMVVISPGPSLSENLHLVREMKGKAVLVCVTHALSALEKEGIVPDVVVSLEAQDIRYHFANYPLDQVPAMVLAVSSLPELFDMGAQRYFTFTGNSHVEKWVYEGLGDDAILNGGGSVSCSGMRLGLRMGCDPVILVGQDLSFKDDGQLYVSSNVDGAARANFKEDGTVTLSGYNEASKSLEAMAQGAAEVCRSAGISLPGYYGGQVRSNIGFSFFLRWFENVAKDFEGKVTLLNCTEGGVYIKGMEHIPLSEAIAQYVSKPVDVAAVLEAAVTTIDRPRRLNHMQRRALSLCDSMLKSKNTAQACLRLAKRARKDESKLNKLSSRERELIEILKPILFLSLMEHKEILEAVEAGGEADTMDAALSAAERLYNVVINAVNAMQQPVQQTVEKLNALQSSLN
jgi:hypothetical protein